MSRTVGGPLRGERGVMGWTFAGVAVTSASALLLQVVLTRLFAVTQGYHYAFMAVGVGLLGFGASGTALSVRLSLRRAPLRTAAWSALLAAPAAGLSLLALTLVPFDAYLVPLQPRQYLYLAVQVTALVGPFFCVGLVVGVVLSAFPARAGRLYAASFLGSGAGAASAVGLLAFTGGPESMLVAAGLAALGAASFGQARRVEREGTGGPGRSSGRPGVIAPLLLAILALAGTRLPLDLPISPYKTLSQLRRFPDARVEFSRWNAVSRVDVVRTQALRSAPGMSYLFAGVPPPLPGLLVDGENARGLPAPVDAAFTEYLPSAAAYRLRAGHVLVVGVGVEVLSARRHGASAVTILESNPLVLEAARRFAGESLASRPGGPAVRTVAENPRTYLRRTAERFDIIQIAPPESFQVVASGTYSLAEHYLYTVEAFRDYLTRLRPGGVLSVTRWIQTPPSEEIRVWAAAVAALEHPDIAKPEDAARAAGAGPAGSRVAALRSLNTLTILVRPEGFTPADIAAVRAFAAARRFDLTYVSGGDAAEANRYNVLPVDLHRQAFLAVLDPAARASFYRTYLFDVRPARDDRPFFFHFFRWEQVPRILSSLGRTWQPFGGSGYLVLLALLAILSILSAGLILAPLRVLRPAPARRTAVPADPTGTPRRAVHRRRVFLYFLALGLAYLFVEVPLLQQMILLLGHPTYALAAVLSTLLLASGAGSLLSARTPAVPALTAVLAGGLAALAWGLPSMLGAAVAFPAPARLAVLAAAVVPPGLLMGLPFPAGIRHLGRTDPALIPWAWGINGCASVVGSVVVVLLALQWGFRTMLVLAGLLYLTAALTFASEERALPPERRAAPPTGGPGERTAPAPGSPTPASPASS